MLEVPADRTKVLSKSNSNKLTFYLSYSGFLTQKIGINFIPVKGGEGSTEVWVLVVIQQTFKARFCVTDLCNECKRVKQWGEFFKQALYSSQCDHFTAASWPSYGSKQIDFIPTAQTRLCLYCNWQWLMIHRYRCLLCHLLKCSYGLLVMSNRMVYVGSEVYLSTVFEVENVTRALVWLNNLFLTNNRAEWNRRIKYIRLWLQNNTC